ncbi:MAG TPA: bifunctional riboflavin kinase/FMN adenylyltransferase, partial [Cytophagaceae bacterium]
MKVYHSLEEFQPLHYAVVTSGTFDGVHKGHQKILARLKEITAECNGEAVVITFWPHPRKILQNSQENDLKLLSTLDEKIHLLKEHGIDHLLIIPFTKEFSQMTSEQFIKTVLSEKINTKKLVIGYDHKFGKNREGSFEHLKENGPIYGFTVEEIPKQDIDHIAISSTNIRKALIEGKINTATEYLGRYYSFTGKVIEGNKLGRKIGYPTANLQLPTEEKIVPKDGVYAVLV